MMSRQSTPRSAVLAIGLSAVAWLLVGAVYAVFTGTTAGRSVDAAVARRDVCNSWEALPEALPGLVSTATTVLAAVVLLWWGRGRGRWREVMRLAVIVVIASAAANAIKHVLSASDPLHREMARAIGPGFYPSGHAAVAMGLALGSWRRSAGASSCSAVASGARFRASSSSPTASTT